MSEETELDFMCLKLLQGVTKQIGGPMHELAAKVDEYARGMISGSGSTLFEELGLYYIGPVDGHNIDDLIAILKEVRSTKTTGPVLIHVVTEKGRGYPYAERAADKYHGKQSLIQLPSLDCLKSLNQYMCFKCVSHLHVSMDTLISK